MPPEAMTPGADSFSDSPSASQRPRTTRPADKAIANVNHRTSRLAARAARSGSRPPGRVGPRCAARCEPAGGRSVSGRCGTRRSACSGRRPGDSPRGFDRWPGSRIPARCDAPPRCGGRCRTSCRRPNRRAGGSIEVASSGSALPPWGQELGTIQEDRLERTVGVEGQHHRRGSSASREVVALATRAGRGSVIRLTRRRFRGDGTGAQKPRASLGSSAGADRQAGGPGPRSGRDPRPGQAGRRYWTRETATTSVSQ